MPNNCIFENLKAKRFDKNCSEDSSPIKDGFVDSFSNKRGRGRDPLSVRFCGRGAYLKGFETTYTQESFIPIMLRTNAFYLVLTLYSVISDGTVTTKLISCKKSISSRCQLM